MGVTHTFVSAIADDPAAAASGQVLPSHWNATHTVNVNLASEVSEVLQVANGGSGTATPSIVAGSNVTVTGTWPGQTIASVPSGSTTQLQYNNAGAFGGASGLTTNGTELTIASGTKTADAPFVNATQTWNNAAVTFTGLKFNVTDTASNAASLLMDLQSSGVSKFKVSKDGSLILTDAIITRDAANVLAQRNGANTQIFRLYNTYTDASNYSRLFIKANNGGGAAQIGFEQAGTGAANNLWFLAPSFVFATTAGTQRWSINSTGHFVGQTDNTYDIGASGATRPRIGYFGTRVDAPTLRTDTAYTVATLPAAGVAGRRAYVTDATAPAFLGALTGGGAVVCPVFDNGTAWIAG